MILAELLARANRALSGGLWVRKFGKLSIRENLVMTKRIFHYMADGYVLLTLVVY